MCRGHKKQPFHEHMNLPNHDVNFIENKRIEQGLNLNALNVIS